jgi:Ser/Thr protein kinase RdoA (MazF antagonist)
MMECEKILSNFKIEGEPTSIVPYGEGHINDTYLVTTTAKKYILQRINNQIFKSPENIMKNIAAVTSHLREQIIARGGDPERETLNIIKTNDGENFYMTPDEEYYRIYVFITDAKSHQLVQEPIHFYNAAKSFALFQRQLADFPAKSLFEPIPNFHNTKVRFENLLKAVKADKVGRVKEVEAEIEFAMARKDEVGIIVDLIEKGDIPVRVTHNDTKYNNIMIDNKTGEGICVIDLDTVMPGSLLYDFGDSIRFGASSALEDETDLSKVFMRDELYEIFTKGFLEVVGDTLAPAEIEYMAFSAKLMTFECGIRFLTDYLDGDNYFKIHRPSHNLDRARNQFKLVSDMETKMDFMKKVVQKYI